MLRFLLGLSLFVTGYSVSYVCTYQQKDYYGQDEIAFQFPKHVVPIVLTSCHTDCLPYEPMVIRGKPVWVGYQSLCSIQPIHLQEESTLDENGTDPKLTYALEDGIYFSYPSTTICVSHKNPC